MTKAEIERLALLIEECAEVVHAASKTLRHGWESRNPFDDEHSNREALCVELGHVRAAVAMMETAGDVSEGLVEASAHAKLSSVGRWLHHQEGRDGR